MRIADILELSTFKQTRVVAGEAGLSNSVQSVNLMDAPDIIHYLNKDQLLLTTAYSIKNNPQDLIDLVKQMAKQECAGLGLKTKRYIQEIPQEIINIANEKNFPIIELSLEHSLGEMLQDALGCILKERTYELNYAMTIHRQFTDIVISGGGFTKIIQSLTSILDSPVILLNYHLDVIAYSPDVDKDSFFDIYWHIHETIHHHDIVDYKVIKLPNQTSNSTFNEVSIYPIKTTDLQKGYIIIFGVSLENNYPFTLALEQAANVISFEFMKIHAIEEHSRRLKNDFFTDLMEGTIMSPEEIMNRGREYKLDKKLHYICITCKMDAASDFHLHPAPMQTEREISHQRDRIYELLESLLGSQFENSILFTKGDLFTILLGFEFYDEMMEQKVQETIAAIQLDIFQTLNSSLSFGISNYTETVTDLPTVFHEAVDALRSGYRENTKRFIKNYRIKELTELFKTIPTQKLKEFYKSSLKDLAYPQDKEKEDLVNTLTSYLNNNCQISDTAKEMYIHRNTVIYRMKKCKKLIGTDLKKEDETLRLRIALFIGSLMENKTTK